MLLVYRTPVRWFISPFLWRCKARIHSPRFKLQTARRGQASYASVKKNTIEILILWLFRNTALGRKANLFWNGMRAGAGIPSQNYFWSRGHIKNLIGNYVCSETLSIFFVVHTNLDKPRAICLRSDRSQKVLRPRQLIRLILQRNCLDGAIIECRYVDRRWFFVRVRNDCEYPNVHIWLSGT